MREYLPKPDDCASIIDRFAKIIDENAEIGLGVTCTSSGKNKFKLKVKCNDHFSFLFLNYKPISINLNELFTDVWPDFIIAPRHFISLKKFYEDFNLDRSMMAFSIIKKLRNLMAANEKLDMNSYFTSDFQRYDWKYQSSGNKTNEFTTPPFQSFSEFLIWIDLNSK